MAKKSKPIDKQKNIEKCQGRRNTIKLATPKWLTEDHKQQIATFEAAVSAINKLGDEPVHLDHILPLDSDTVCGLHAPWNMQILTAKDNREKGNTYSGDGSPHPNAVITYDDIVSNKGLRFKGKFLKGFSGNTKGRPKTVDENLEAANDDFLPLYSDLISRYAKQDADFFKEAADLLGKTAHLFKSPIRAELIKWCDKFGAYYRPKISSIEGTDQVDNRIVVEIINPSIAEGDYDNDINDSQQ